MRKNFGAKPVCYPMPVYVIGTYGTDGTPNTMVAAWGGISEKTEISISVSAGHKTAKNVLERKAFTVSMATARHIAACDYVGIVSGNTEPNKLARAGFHVTRSEFVDAPLIHELPMAMECRLLSYDPESSRLLGEIVNISADESILDESGKIDPAKLQPITYDAMNRQYFVLGNKVGKAYHDGLSLK